MEFRYENAQISQGEIEKHGERLKTYINHVNNVTGEGGYNQYESFINLTSDENLSKTIAELKERLVGEKLKYVIDIGIGGSSLGTKAVYDALYGFFDVIQPNRFPKTIFLDTNDTQFLHLLKGFFKTQVRAPEEIIINAVSKSGNTTETLANLEIVASEFPQTLKRMVITTTRNSKLREEAEKQNIPCLEIPQKISGRYSVFSAVGQFPLACTNVNVEKLLQGAKSILDSCLDKEIQKNPAVISAITLFHSWKSGKTITDSFFFHPELESLGEWYRQLMAESTGKEGKGITPTVSIGSTDLHSVGQLNIGGPKDKIFTLIWAKTKLKVRVPQQEKVPILPEIEGKTTSEIMEAIREGVKKTYKEENLPFMEVALESVSEKSLGKFMQFKMMEMIYLAKLLDVNAFDQPDVEEYKKETRKLLLNI